MLLATESNLSSSLLSARDIPESSVSPRIPFHQYEQFKVIPRNGSVISPELAKISIALTKHLVTDNGVQKATTARRRIINRTARCCNRVYPEQFDLPAMQNVQNWNAAIYGAPVSMGRWGERNIPGCLYCFASRIAGSRPT